MNKTYLFSVIIGFILFTMVYYYNKQLVEKFEITDSTADTANSNNSTETTETTETNTEDTGNNVILSDGSSIYIEKLTSIPNNKNLKYYLTTFSDAPHYNKEAINYDSSTQKWYNFINDSVPFTLVANDGGIPGDVKSPNGLELKNIKLSGPPSDYLNSTTEGIIFKSFTFSFYVKFNDIVFGTNNRFDILNIFLEWPNRLNISMEKIENDSDNINILITVGETNYRIPIAKTTFLTGSNVLMSISLNQNDNKLTVYIGDIEYVAELSNGNAKELKLGNSNVVINKDYMWDIKMLSFMYFSNGITLDTHKQLLEYLSKQNSGLDEQLEKIEKITTEAIKQYKNKVVDFEKKISMMTGELSKCSALALEKEEAEKQLYKDKWRVKMNEYKDVSDEDIQKCSILKVNNPYTKAVTDTNNTSNSTTSTTSNSSTEQKNNGKVIDPNSEGASKPENVLTQFKDSIVNYFKN